MAKFANISEIAKAADVIKLKCWECLESSEGLLAVLLAIIIIIPVVLNKFETIKMQA